VFCKNDQFNCVPKSVAFVETQTMPSMAESVSSHPNLVSMCVNQDTKKPIRYRNFCYKIEPVSNNSPKHVSVSADQNEVQSHRALRNYIVRPRYACVCRSFRPL